MATSSTPLLTALRGYRSEEFGAGLPFQSLLTFLGCLIPMALCLYLMDIKPLFQIGDVEFTQPDSQDFLFFLFSYTYFPPLCRG
jgi:hypothetical protein